MKSYTQLTQEKRYQIYAFKAAGDTPAQIARKIEVHPSTVLRELARNRGARGYCPKQAHQKARTRQAQRAAQPRKSTISPETWCLIEAKIRQEWSPEQVSGWLQNHAGVPRAGVPRAGVPRAGVPQSVSHERIYQHIYADKKAGGTLHEHLRCQKKRRKRYGSGRNRRGEIQNKVPIEARPAVVEERSRVGDWELDTIIGKGHQGAIVSLVERKSRLTLLQKVDGRTAVAVKEAIVSLLHDKCVHTLTSDNGKEFALHEQIAQAVEGDFFFANPYCSWERAANENANGLVRQYLPKGSDFVTLSHHDVELVMNKLNHRPRKILGFQTPQQVYEHELTVALTT